MMTVSGHASTAVVPTWREPGVRQASMPAPPACRGALGCTGGSWSGAAASCEGPHSLLRGG